MVTHLSLDYFQALQQTLSHWKEPMAVALWVQDLTVTNIFMELP